MTDPKGTRRLLAQRVTDTSCENSGLQNLFKKKKKRNSLCLGQKELSKIQKAYLKASSYSAQMPKNKAMLVKKPKECKMA